MFSRYSALTLGFGFAAAANPLCGLMQALGHFTNSGQEPTFWAKHIFIHATRDTPRRSASVRFLALTISTHIRILRIVGLYEVWIILIVQTLGPCGPQPKAGRLILPLPNLETIWPLKKSSLYF